MCHPDNIRNNQFEQNSDSGLMLKVFYKEGILTWNTQNVKIYMYYLNYIYI